MKLEDEIFTYDFGKDYIHLLSPITLVTYYVAKNMIEGFKKESQKTPHTGISNC